jgi:excisionase family DNA binding protein
MSEFLKQCLLNLVFGLCVLLWLRSMTIHREFMNLSPEWVKAFAEHAELSAREAADLLNIPYALLVKDIEADLIPHRKTGKSYRIRFNDLMGYKEMLDRKS